MQTESFRPALPWIVLFLLAQIVVLATFGQSFLSASGMIQLWQGTVLSPENSQQIADWYTFSHIIHGFIFFYITYLFFPRMTLYQRMLVALAVEIGWEITENTPWIINRYREQALAQGYSGDSILNSVSDSCAMLLGFIASTRLPAWAIVFLAIGLEIFVGFSIRDNLTLNVINLLYPVPAISAWQSGI